MWPGHNYSVTVQIKSGDNKNDDLLWWSDPQTLEIQMPPSVPLRSPITRPGLFQSNLDLDNNGKRSVIIYWKGLHEKYKGGHNFYYRIKVFSNESRY